MIISTPILSMYNIWPKDEKIEKGCPQLFDLHWKNCDDWNKKWQTHIGVRANSGLWQKNVVRRATIKAKCKSNGGSHGKNCSIFEVSVKKGIEWYEVRRKIMKLAKL